MRVLVTLLLALLLQLGSLGYGTAFQSLQSYLLLISRKTSRRHSHQATSPAPARLLFAPSEPPWMWIAGHMAPASAPALAPALAPKIPVSAPRPSRRHRRRHPHAYPPTAFYPPPGPECQIICPDPLTTTPFGSPCGCVLPMRVELDLGVAPFRVFSVVIELMTEVASGTYMKQSQVRIMGAAASDQDPSKTRVNIDLVPLGEKFDNMTALLIYERFWRKKVAINASIFGDYDVISVRYPGLPASSGSGASGPSGTDSYPNPFVANVPPSKNKSLNARMVVIIALSSFILILTFLAITCIIIKWKRLARPSTVGPGLSPSVAKRSGFRSVISSSLASSTSVSVSTMGTCPPSVKTFSLLELEKATDKFSSKRVLGEGGFGRVYHGTIEDGTHVAVKLLTRDDHSGDREFIAEVVMLSRLHHRNLVKLIGICIEGRTRCLVYELVHNGSVESHLHGADKECGPLDWDTRLKIALGAARGLAYLHEDSNPRVIHRDFKASNVLLENDFTPKVSDFGLAREASEGVHHISTRVMGTFGYVAPEYAMTGHLLVKSDVYSYGVVLLELLSGRKPVDNSQPYGQENLVTWARPLLTSTEGLQQLVDPYLDGKYDFDNMAKVAAIASMCVHPEVSQRPFMGEVVQALKLIYNDLDMAYDDVYSQREEGSPAPDCDFRGETGTDSSWWNRGTPSLAYGCASFVTMEYSSGLVGEMHRPHSSPTLFGRGEPLVRQNRSGPLQTKRHNSSLARLRGSMSEHQLLSRRFGGDGYWA